MQVIRQNTDYALRAMIHLAERGDNGPVSARKLAQAEQISPQFASKIMQRLQSAHLVTSTMGPKGGFVLARPAEEINLLDVIQAVQGPVSVSDCVFSRDVCPRRPACTISPRLAALQRMIEGFLKGISVADLVNGTGQSDSQFSCREISHG